MNANFEFLGAGHGQQAASLLSERCCQPVNLILSPSLLAFISVYWRLIDLLRYG
jgi:hypothetical protein